MERVAIEAENAAADFAPGPVHDLRVALRRCRSMAAGYAAIDPEKSWRSMTKTGRRLFKRLGDLRDVQVTERWVRFFADENDPFSVAMLSHLSEREIELKEVARHALRDFDLAKWNRWTRRLQGRARLVRTGGAVFQLSALSAFQEARCLHKQALRNRSARSFHRVRIGLKHFRYLVENFLPDRHEEWGDNLKDLQAWLGDHHDLTVFKDTAVRIRAFPDNESADRLRRRIADEKAARIALYREKMLGDGSLWQIWRRGLPRPGRLQSYGLALIRKWALLRGADPKLMRDICRLALQMHAGLNHSDRLNSAAMRSGRNLLQIATALHAARKTKRKGKIVELPEGLLDCKPLLSAFSPEELRTAALIARCSQSTQQDVEAERSPVRTTGADGSVRELTGIMRLATALVRSPESLVGRMTIQDSGDSIVIRVENFPELGPFAEKVARARHLLEYCLRRPILIRRLLPDEALEETAS